MNGSRTNAWVAVASLMTVAGIAPGQPPEEATQTDQPPNKAPYSVVYFDFGFGGFSSQSTSASAPTQACPNGVQTNFSKSCTEVFSTVPSIDFLGFGVRPIRYLQVGMTLDYLGNFSGFPTQTASYQCTSGCTGTEVRSIVPRSFLFTGDARFVLPLFRERLLLSVGGGIALVQVSQEAQTIGNEQLVGCNGCQTRNGHGPTEVIELVYLPGKHFGFGFHVRNAQISSSGLTPDAGPPASGSSITYKDRFVSIGGGVSFRFGTHH